MSKEPSFEIVEITPEMAKTMLSANTGNRKIREKQVAALTRDIESGNWHMNGDAIRFNGDGTLLDGQHRLVAVIKSGKPIKSLVVHGIDSEAKRTIDTGAKRSAGDYFSFQGIKDPYSVAAACRYAMMMRHPVISARAYTMSETWDFYEAHPGIATDDYDFRRVKGGMGAATRAGYYIAREVAPHIAEDFADAWVGGYGGKGNPALTCRERIITAALSGNPLSTTHKLRMCAWSLVKMAKGQSISHIRIPEQIVIPGWTVTAED